MRYPDGGGLSEQGRTKREAVRLQAAEWFAQDMPVAEIAGRLRATTNAVYVWRRQWQVGGTDALMSKGPGGSSFRLGEQRQARLVRAWEQGPAAHGFDEDQHWTLTRVSDLIARCSISATPCGACRCCCTAWGFPRRSRHTERSNATRKGGGTGGARPDRPGYPRRARRERPSPSADHQH
jgi:transposase-like protein